MAWLVAPSTDAKGDNMLRTSQLETDQARNGQVRRDLDAWVRGTGENYDSVVVVGGHGITTHTFAARLARNPGFAGKVVLAGRPKEESRRLIGGVSLRARAADYLAYAAGLDHSQLIAEIAGDRSAVASTRQVASMAYTGKDGTWNFTRPGPWQNHRRRKNRPVMYGFRNSRMAVAVRDSIADGAVIQVDDTPTSLDEARELAVGDRPLIVNGSTDDELLGNEAGSHTWGIVAAQVPFTSPTPPRAPLEPATTFAPLVRRDGAIDVGYYTPFLDEMSPEANWYGIIARPVRSGELVGAEADLQKEIVTDELLGIGDACGLTPVDPDDTLATAAVPGADWSAPKAPIAPGTFELRQSCSAGVPAYYADGILCGAMGGLAAAEAVIRGADPTASATAAISKIRFWNRVWWLETTKLAIVADRLMRANVSAAMVYPHSSSAKWWASAA